MYIRIAENSPESRWRQIYSAIRDRILSGALRMGTSLPSIRQLAADTTVSVITVKRAYQQLEAEGYIVSQQGRGTFVAELEQDEIRRRRLKEWREAIGKIVEEGRGLGLDAEDIYAALEHFVGKERV
jgi:GntR family transcriptional regulator